MAYTKSNVSYNAIVAISVISGKVDYMARVFHIPQDVSRSPSKTIASFKNFQGKLMFYGLFSKTRMRSDSPEIYKTTRNER